MVEFKKCSSITSEDYMTHFIAILLILTSFSVFSQPSSGRGERQHQRPPQEALDICLDKLNGDECSFTHNSKVEQGKCFAPEENLPLACRPSKIRK